MLLQASRTDGFVQVAWWEYSKILILLGLMVAGAAWLVRNMDKLPGARRSGRKGPISMLAQFPLEPRKTLYLVKIGEEVLLIGAADNSVSLLKTLPPNAVDEQLQEEGVRAPSVFWTKLAELRRQ